MENPFKDLRVRMALIFAAFSIGGAYLAIVDHVLIGRRMIGRLPANTGIVAGIIEALLGLAVLGYAWKTYRRIMVRNRDSGPQI